MRAVFYAPAFRANCRGRADVGLDDMVDYNARFATYMNSSPYDRHTQSFKPLVTSPLNVARPFGCGKASLLSPLISCYDAEERYTLITNVLQF